MKIRLLVSTLFIVFFCNGIFANSINDLKQEFSNYLTCNKNADAYMLTDYFKSNHNKNNGKATGDITYGSECVFKSNATEHIDIATIDATHILMVYADADDFYHGKSVIGTISGTTITYGSEVAISFSTNVFYYISVSMLDATHFVIAYNYVSGTTQPYFKTVEYWGGAICGTISGTTITYGTEYTFNNSNTTYNSVTALDATHFIIAYRDGNGYGTAIHGTVSGTNITWGSEYAFNSASTTFISASAINSSSAIVAYRDAGNSNYGASTVLSVTGTGTNATITNGSEYVFNSASTDYVSTLLINSTSFIVAYRDVGNLNYGTAIKGSISGSTLSYGSEYIFNLDNTTSIKTTKINETQFVVGYTDNGNSSYGTTIMGTIGSGITFVVAGESVFNSATTSYCAITALGNASGDAKFAVAYKDEGNSSRGTNIIGTLEDIDGDALPIELLDFYYKIDDDNSIELNWSTASETNNELFEIQQSDDAENFETIGKVAGAGNSNKITDYQFSINNNTGLKYYRLKQIDFDGKFEFLKTIAVDFTNKTQNKIEVYPNPFFNELVIGFQQIPEDEFEITITNSYGQVVKQQTINTNSPIYKLNLSSSLSSGIYFLKFEINNQLFVRKIIKE